VVVDTDLTGVLTNIVAKLTGQQKKENERKIQREKAKV
jgi:hypothetical protein